jgi:peptidoglycan biosynthesis protein MviN/MurJ (putative lipid II flippase)
VALNLLFNWIFTFQLGWGHRGLAFSTGLVASCNFLLLYALMRRHLQSLESGRLLRMLAKVSVASLGLVAVCETSSHWLLSDWATQPFGGKLAALLATVIIGAGVFVGAGAMLRIEELDEILGAVRRRLHRAR